MDVKERFRSIQNWFVAQTSILPYIAGYQIRQIVDTLPKRYPNHVLVHAAGFLVEDNGKKGWFVASTDEEVHSAEKLLTDPEALKKLFKDMDTAEKELLAYLEDAEDIDETFQEHDFFTKFLKLYDAAFIPGLALDGFAIVGEQIANRVLNEHPEAKKDVALLVHPQKLTFFEKEELDLIDLALKTVHAKIPADSLLNDQKFRTLLEKHQQKYYWIESSYKHARGLPMNSFVHRITDLLKLSQADLKQKQQALKDLPKQRLQRCERIVKGKRLSKHDTDQLLLLGQIAWYLDRRKAISLRGNFYIDRHLHVLCDMHKLPYETVSFLLPWELEKIMAGELKLEDINTSERRKHGLYFRDIEQQEFFLVSADAKQARQSIFPPVDKEIFELQGSSTFPGVLTGRARIVHDPHTVDDFREGDILVTGMTRPDFVSLVKKAGAIVTDEGGIISHAAILSRELEKPCVLGTRIASRILKDGEMVHVDATMGLRNEHDYR